MKRGYLLGVLLVMLGMGPHLDAGEIYHWIDKDGVWHFTDDPPPPGAEKVEGLSDTLPAEPKAHSGQAGPEAKREKIDREIAPPEPEDTGSVDRKKDGATSREDYWRRKGWGDDTTDKKGEGEPEGDQNRPIERKAD